MPTSLAVTFTPTTTTVNEDVVWLAFEQDAVVTEAVTASEAASLIDALFDTNPCEEEATTGGQEASEPEITEEEFTETVQETLDFALCEFDDSGNCTITLRVYRSHQDKPYKVQLTNGRILSTVSRREEVSVTATIDGAASYTIKRPFITAPTITWSRNLVAASAPQVNVVGSTLYLDQEVTGTFTATFVTEWDELEIQVYGVDGEPGECTALGFYDGLVYEHEIEVPEPDDTVIDTTTFCAGASYELADGELTCFKTVHVAKKCQCSGEVVGYDSYQVETPCPDGVTAGSSDAVSIHVGTEYVDQYVDCNESDGIDSAAYYEATCCEPPDVSLPACIERKATYTGGHEIQYGAEYWRQRLGDNVRLVPVGPPGMDCGTLTVTQDMTGRNCCANATPIYYDEETSAPVAADWQAVLIRWDGGLPPYTVRVAGTGFYADEARSQQTVQTSATSAGIYTGNACGTGVIIITDVCGNEAQGVVLSINGQWVALEYISATRCRSLTGFTGVLDDGFPTSNTSASGLTFRSQWRQYRFDQGYSFSGTGGDSAGWSINPSGWSAGVLVAPDLDNGAIVKFQDCFGEEFAEDGAWKPWIPWDGGTGTTNFAACRYRHDNGGSYTYGIHTGYTNGVTCYEWSC